MKEQMVGKIRCPADHGLLRLEEAERADGEIRKGRLVCGHCGEVYPILDFIPRFVPMSNYADDFAFQRVKHARLQMDKFNGTTFIRDTILSRSGWDGDFLKGKTVLECGCGAGPDTQVLLDMGAQVTAVDISGGVDFCRDNNYPSERLDLIQADIMNLPLEADSYDVVFCQRVIQHTPDPEAAFAEIVRCLRGGGGAVSQ